MPPTIVVVAGTSSNVGKTTLVCDLLKALPRWEAIKITRGHFRSCGKSPETCCVSLLLAAEPIVYAAPERTKAPGKDTARYWDAGASNVHWLVGTATRSIWSDAGCRQSSIAGGDIEGTACEILSPALSVLVVPTVAGEVSLQHAGPARGKNSRGFIRAWATKLRSWRLTRPNLMACRCSPVIPFPILSPDRPKSSQSISCEARA